MKKNLLCILTIILLATALYGCSGSFNTTKSYTYTVETGDKINVTMRTGDGYRLLSDLPFTITNDGQTLSQGFFTYADDYYHYVDVAYKDAQILDEGTTDDLTYIFWNYDDTEYNYAILIKNSNTCVVLANSVSRESAEECFSRLTFTIQKS